MKTTENLKPKRNTTSINWEQKRKTVISCTWYNPVQSIFVLLHHSSGILVSPNHRGGSNPEPPDKVLENSFLLQYTYIHILYL